MGTVRVVNLTPGPLSGETNHDSEPNLAVNPQRPTDMVATAFTPDLSGGTLAPIYVSTDGGFTWALRKVIPGNNRSFGTNDITVAFAPTGGTLYAGILNGQGNFRMQILRTTSFASNTPMTVLVDRFFEDQPWVVAGGSAGSTADRVFVGHNDQRPGGVGFPGASAAVDVSQAAAAPAPAFTETGLEHKQTQGRDGPPVRIALHPDGTVYAAFQPWKRASRSVFPDVSFDVVVLRDDAWAGGASPFSDLTEGSGPSGIGATVTGGGFMRFGDIMGQERLGGDLAIAVDPSNSSTVWVAYCDRTGGAAGTDWALFVARSTDRGRNWSTVRDVRPTAKNPALAVNSDGLVGLTYQELAGSQWVTRLELSSDAWATTPTTHVLHQSPSNTPPAVPGRLPYLGDYIRLLTVGRHFYGVFSGNNTPDIANFPSGVSYQRLADWTNRVLLNVDGVTPVTISIDPFFFEWSPLRPIPRGGVSGPPVRGTGIQPPGVSTVSGPPIRGPGIRPPPSISPRGPIIREPGPVRPTDLDL
jgi:hypothetical protein